MKSNRCKTRKAPGIIFIILGFVTLFLALAAASPAQLPSVNTPLENRLYLGNSEGISAFINERLTQIDNLITNIDALAAESSSSSDLQNRAASLKDFFHGISQQYRSLLAELVRSHSPITEKPQVVGPPFRIDAFDRLINFQRQVDLQISETAKKAELLGNRLTSLKDNAVGLLSEYAKLIKTREHGQLLLYEKYAELISLQGEYALLMIKKPKIELRLNQLKELRQQTAELISQAFNQLMITPEDLESAEQENQKQKQLLQETTDATSAEFQDLNRRIAIYEAQLDSTLIRITENKDNDSAREGWQIEKERIELIIEALKLRIQLINQKRLNCEIKLLQAEFRLAWLTKFQDPEKRERLADFINHWSRENDRLGRTKENITNTISETTLLRSNLTQRLVAIQNKMEAAPKASLREAFGVLSRQAVKVNENIDKLIMALADNDQALKGTRREFSQILSLARYASSPWERLQTRSHRHLSDIKESLQNILYYPLFSFGTSTIDLLTILKIVFLFFFGIVSLRLLRRKIAKLLEKKAAMSIGAVNSITTLGYYASLLIGSIIILSSAGLDLSQLSLILGALGVGIGFGLQTITNNFISGIILLSEQSVKVGDLITLTDGLVGEVKNVSIRSTIIRTIEGEDIILPNSDLISNRVNTWTYSDDWRRLNIPFGVSYDADPDEVVRLAEAAAREVAITREDFMHPLRIFFEGFGDSSLDFSIRVWCRMTNLKAPTGLKTDYYLALFRKFREAGISIPYPQQDLHLKTVSPEVLKQLSALLRKAEEHH
ncbi:MAG TPA: mechanosensitive ion channel [Proteobacteria bacterium]|nr:mechanosensitive ion channel [Pseudomonadota bacterium]